MSSESDNDSDTDAAAERGGPDLEELLLYLKTSRGLDFTGYKRASLTRRIHKRMSALGTADYAAYCRHLDTVPDEYAALFESLLINVTSFFRDAEAWTCLAEDVIPRILRDATGSTQIRVWSAGCASGEEPYSVAMLLAEAMTADDFARRVKIYATDWDSAALIDARRAQYPLKRIENVPEHLRAKYFTVDGGKAVLDGALRRAVIFGRQDLTEDPPISRLDLLVCRNTLMYFTAATQRRILSRMHFALGEHGFLFLGRAEMLLSHDRYFAPFGLRHRIFCKVPAHSPVVPARFVDEESPMRTPPDPTARVGDAALDAGPIAQIVLDAADRLMLTNQRARAMFHLASPDLGRRLQDLEISYRPADLRSLLDRCRELQGPCSIEVSRELADGEIQYLEITATPLLADGQRVATAIAFDDVTRHQRLKDHLQHFSENLETAYEELQSANEELETTNEELQSSNEELETTNEELQATNEEMETINEELRSTNEQLQTVNEQLRGRKTELASANTFLQAILSSLDSGVAVVDANLAVQVWNDRAVELWGIRVEEAQGKSIVALDIGLPVAQLAVPLHEALRTGEGAQLVLDAVNRRGRALKCRVTITPLRHSEPVAATVLMDVLPESAGD